MNAPARENDHPWLKRLTGRVCKALRVVYNQVFAATLQNKSMKTIKCVLF